MDEDSGMASALTYRLKSELAKPGNDCLTFCPRTHLFLERESTPSNARNYASPRKGNNKQGTVMRAKKPFKVTDTVVVRQ